jgi:hypothetical protein
VNSPPPKLEVILTNCFAEPIVLLVAITSHAYCVSHIHQLYMIDLEIDDLCRPSLVVSPQNTNIWIIYFGGGVA